jgi:DNA-binding response OmpR family regulator
MAKVLIVDDDPQYADILSFEFGQQGFETHVAHNETQVIELVTQIEFDLIMLDVFLPNKENGLQILLKLKDNINTDQTPVILMTSQPTELFKQEENVDEYLRYTKELLSKVDSPQKIAQRVKAILLENGKK